MKETPNTWFVDFDGTIVEHKSHMRDYDVLLPSSKTFFETIVDENDCVIITTARGIDHKDRVENFLKTNNIKFNAVLCNITAGSRILINDKKPDGKLTAFAYNLERDTGIQIEHNE